MNRLDIVRFWKDEAYRQSLSEAERAALPENPAGLVEIDGACLQLAGGGTRRKEAGPSARPSDCAQNTLLCATMRPLCRVVTRTPCGPGPGTLYCTKVACTRTSPA
jgi:mersacidin/lichenicidin family type 2 lantibiotic